MIDHIGILVTDLDRSVAFYTRALAPLGYEVVMRLPQAAGLGVAGKPDFWIAVGKPTDSIHVALRARGRRDVRAFHDAAIAAGGTDNGAPGVRAHYHPSYYAAFVRDPDGHNIEAVCHEAYLD
ncbi:MAG TPA: VOC family protein [Kofleriaceae bacterium]|nr:VOC family protein [Kofleriaceae bacterium]